MTDADTRSTDSDPETIIASLRGQRAFVTDATGRVLEATVEFRRLIGTDRVVETTPPFPWWPPEEQKLLSSLFDRVLAGEADDLQGHPFRLRLLHASGRRLPIDVRIHHTSGGLFCFLHDTAPVDSPSKAALTQASVALAQLTRALAELGIRTPPAERPGWRRLVARSPLTTREGEILDLLLAGKRSDEIAEILGVSANTVKHHAHSIFRKVGARSHVELLAMALGDRI